MRRLRLLLALSVATWLSACGSSNVAGGSSGHENVLQAVILDSASQPVAGARVTLRPANFLHGSDAAQALQQESDSLGRVRFAQLATGLYWLEVSKAGLGSFQQVSTDSTTPIRAKVAPLGMLQQCLTQASTGDTAYILGTDRFGIVGLDGCTSLDSLPIATYSLQVAHHALAVTVQHGLRVALPAGHGTAHPAYVPLRLTASDLDFAASLGQAGLHAIGQGGATLPIDIEEWDSAAGSALVWVRLDSLPAGGATLFLRQESQAASAASAFGSDGWLQAWHFARKDTSLFANHGSLDAAGVVGSGRRFASRSDYIQTKFPPSLASNGFLSLWVRIDSMDQAHETPLASAGSVQLKAIGTADSSGLEALLVVGTDTLRLESTTAMGKGDWHLVALSWQANGTANLRVDGATRASVSLPGSVATSTDSLRVGGFLGAVDELRLGSVIAYDDATQALDTLLQSRHSTAVKWTRF